MGLSLSDRIIKKIQKATKNNKVFWQDKSTHLQSNHFFGQYGDLSILTEWQQDGQPEAQVSSFNKGPLVIRSAAVAELITTIQSLPNIVHTRRIQEEVQREMQYRMVSERKFARDILFSINEWDKEH